VAATRRECKLAPGATRGSGSSSAARDPAPRLRPVLDLMGETFVDASGFVPPDPEEMAEIARQYGP